MATTTPTSTSRRYTSLSDRFRSLWTFYQFLGGVFKHQGRGPVPVDRDFQDLYRRLQGLVQTVGMDDGSGEAEDTIAELDRIEAELLLIHSQLARAEQQLAPSLLRRFFDHLKRQDEKILYAMVKFYLMADQLEDDTLDKLDMLLTRLAEAPLEDGRVLLRDPAEMRQRFERFAKFLGLKPLPKAEERPLVEVIRELREEIQRHRDFTVFIESGVLDRFRKCKHRLGPALMHPPVLVEVISTNIEAKNRFQQLYQEEEARILEDTNRIFEIERYIERNPGLAHRELREQLDTFRRYRMQFDSSRRDDNVKREDVIELRQAMQRVIESFEQQQAIPRAPLSDQRPAAPDQTNRQPTGAAQVPSVGAAAQAPDCTGAQMLVEAGRREPAADPPDELAALAQSPAGSVESAPGRPFEPSAVHHPPQTADRAPGSSADQRMSEIEGETWSRSDGDLDDLFEAEPIPAQELVDAYAAAEPEPVEPLDPGNGGAGELRKLLPPDPVIDETLDKIMFALDLVVWDNPSEIAAQAQEIQYLELEPWEVDAFRKLASHELGGGTLAWELERFLLCAAALRLRMDEELDEITRLNQTENAQLLMDTLECSVTSLERARQVEDRFRWHIEDLLYRGETERMDQIQRSRFRFLLSFSRLWLTYEAGGGVTPL